MTISPGTPRIQSSSGTIVASFLAQQHQPEGLSRSARPLGVGVKSGSRKAAGSIATEGRPRYGPLRAGGAVARQRILAVDRGGVASRHLRHHEGAASPAQHAPLRVILSIKNDGTVVFPPDCVS
jgi:hypothetical protein